VLPAFAKVEYRNRIETITHEQYVEYINTASVYTAYLVARKNWKSINHSFEHFLEQYIENSEDLENVDVIEGIYGYLDKAHWQTGYDEMIDKYIALWDMRKPWKRYSEAHCRALSRQNGYRLTSYRKKRF